MTGPVPYSLHIEDSAIADLRQRLARTRLPDQAPGEPWALGTDVAYMADLLRHWQDGFDWRAQEAALNAFPQAMVRVGNLDVHCLHVPGQGAPGAAPRPLLLLHGWPGSVFEFLDIIPLLCAPPRGFTVVAPSLPGYGLSFRPGQRRYGANDMADACAGLMTALGYGRFMVQGGDWGASVGTRLAFRCPERVIGLHLNLLPLAPSTVEDGASAEERAYHEEGAAWQREEGAYQAIQGTKPQTLAFAMTDSPAGLAAWQVEKFRTWSDCGGTIEDAIPRDRMLANIALYWFTGAIGSSFHPYYARLHGDPLVPEGRTVDVPMAYAAFPQEIRLRRPPRSLAARLYSDIRRWTPMPRGGHFAALEQPALLAGDVRAFAAGLDG